MITNHSQIGTNHSQIGTNHSQIGTNHSQIGKTFSWEGYVLKPSLVYETPPKTYTLLL